jgi:hypothetical protein
MALTGFDPAEASEMYLVMTGSSLLSKNLLSVSSAVFTSSAKVQPGFSWALRSLGPVTSQLMPFTKARCALRSISSPDTAAAVARTITLLA